MENRQPNEEISSNTSQGIEVKKMTTSNTDPHVLNDVDSTVGRKLGAPEMALSYYPVLRNIFRMMREEDLEIGRQVNKFWGDVAHLMMSNHYEVQLGTPYYNFEYENPSARKQDWVLVKKWDRHNPQRFTQYDTTVLLLKEDLESREVSISLKLDEDAHIRGPRVKKFISKFGHLIVELDYFCQSSLSLNPFCKLLLEDLPNLENLNFSPRFYDEDLTVDPNFKPDLIENKHKQLKRVTLGSYTSCRFESLVKIFKLAENLEEIHKLPIWLINAVVVTKTGPFLKSVSYTYENDLRFFARNGLTVLSAFEQLAHLKPKLTTFTVPPRACSFEEGTSIEMFKPLGLSILQSSAESLQSFEIGASDWSVFQNCIPQLKGVKTLIFDYPSGDFHLFSLPKISLRNIFPNVSEMRIRFKLNENSMSRYLPERIISPWGSQIKSLLLGSLTPSSMPFLRKIFPEVEHLQFTGSAKQIADLLPVLAEFWPQLKTMTILLKPDYSLDYGKLDCAFTGLSGDVVAQLLIPSERRKFTHDQIQSFKRQSSICKLKELKELTIKQKNNSSGWIDHLKEFTTFTHVTNEFAFKLLPHLKVTLEIWKNNKTWKVSEGVCC